MRENARTPLDASLTNTIDPSGTISFYGVTADAGGNPFFNVTLDGSADVEGHHGRHSPGSVTALAPEQTGYDALAVPSVSGPQPLSNALVIPTDTPVGFDLGSAADQATLNSEI